MRMLLPFISVIKTPVFQEQRWSLVPTTADFSVANIQCRPATSQLADTPGNGAQEHFPAGERNTQPAIFQQYLSMADI